MDGVTRVDGRTDEVGDWVAQCAPGRLTALVGAGISTDSGIPDFRGPNGVWTKDPSAQQMFTLQSYVADPTVRRQSWRNRRNHPAWTAEPNAAHRALVDLERAGVLQAVITQNIDELHQRAGSSPERVIEVHGTLYAAQCLDCGDRTPMREVLNRVDAGEEDPPCRRCGGLLKAATISFGQSLVPEVLAAAVRAARNCDLFLAVGTSLSVQPVAGLTGVAAGSGARVVIINAQPTPYDEIADAVLRGPIGELLPAIVRRALPAANR